jgi:maltose/moltooligosaccharide transporter
MKDFNYKTAFLLGLGFFGISAVWAAYNSFVPVILKNLALSNAMIGLIMTIDNILAVTVQPAIGALSDRTNTAIGRRKPFIMAGAPAAVICFAMIPFVNNLYLLAAVILLMNLGMAIYRSPVIALMPDTFEPQHRSRANGIINLMGGIGALITFFIAGSLFDISRRGAFILVACTLLVSIFFLVILIREKPDMTYEMEEKSDGRLERSSIWAFFFAGMTFCILYFGGFLSHTLAEIFGGNVQRSLIAGMVVFAFIIYKIIAGEIETGVLKFFLAIFLWFFGYNAIETFFTLYCKEEIGLGPGKGTILLGIFSLGFIIAAVPSGILSVKIGRRKMIVFGLLALAAISILISLSANVILIGILMFAGGAAWAAVNINAYPAVCDSAPIGRLGRFTGYYYFFSMLAQTLSPPANGILIDLTGSYKTVFVTAAVFFVAAVPMTLFLTKKKEN